MKVIKTGIANGPVRLLIAPTAILALALAVSNGVVLGEPASPLHDGEILKTEPCEQVKTSYDDYIAYLKREHDEDVKSAARFDVKLPSWDAMQAAMLTRQEYEHRLHDPRFECARLIYGSDGLKVVGYLFRPVDVRGRRLPLIIYNRGGHADVDEVGTITLLQVHPFLDAGFVVLAPQYRGSDGGEGTDEFGGADVDDVLHLVPLARSLGYVDMDNLFMFGVSRGGMETYLAMKRQVPINAAAVLGASSDEVAGNRRRPLTEVYQKLVPGFDQHPQASLRERSAVLWAEQLDEPILMLHGGADWRVSPDESLELGSRLQALHKVYQLSIYAGDDHELSMHRNERDRQIVNWFKEHLKSKG